ncbi:hypothetical protein ACFFW8_11675 [Erwinia tracheiphila]
MAISFQDIPDNIRVPLCYIEFDNSAAVKGTPQTLHKTLLLGLRLNTGSVPAGQPFRITSASAAESAFGRGSMLSTMAGALLRPIPTAICGLLPLMTMRTASGQPEPLRCQAPAKTSGQIALMIAGTSVRVTALAGGHCHRYGPENCRRRQCSQNTAGNGHFSRGQSDADRQVERRNRQ